MVVTVVWSFGLSFFGGGFSVGFFVLMVFIFARICYSVLDFDRFFRSRIKFFLVGMVFGFRFVEVSFRCRRSLIYKFLR